jgi:hypothetical protein
VEELDQPSLKNQPMAVGGLGMICTANYEVRLQQHSVPIAIAAAACTYFMLTRVPVMLGGVTKASFNPASHL